MDNRSLKNVLVKVIRTCWLRTFQLLRWATHTLVLLWQQKVTFIILQRHYISHTLPSPAFRDVISSSPKMPNIGTNNSHLPRSDRLFIKEPSGRMVRKTHKNHVTGSNSMTSKTGLTLEKDKPVIRVKDKKVPGPKQCTRDCIRTCFSIHWNRPWHVPTQWNVQSYKTGTSKIALPSWTNGVGRPWPALDLRSVTRLPWWSVCHQKAPKHHTGSTIPTYRPAAMSSHPPKQLWPCCSRSSRETLQSFWLNLRNL